MDSVAEVLAEYYTAFSSQNIDAILPYFNEPTLLINPRGVFAAATRSELAEFLRQMMDDLRTKGYGRSELEILDSRPLSAATASVRGIAIRYRSDGPELERAGITYLLQKQDAHWKIAVIVIHDVQV